jgi:hypothetical protein
MPRGHKRRQCDAAAPTLAGLQMKLDSVRREVRNLTVMGLDPNQTPDQARLIKQLERSARAEMRLRSMALGYAKSKLRPFRHRNTPTDDFRAFRGSDGPANKPGSAISAIRN